MNLVVLIWLNEYDTEKYAKEGLNLECFNYYEICK